MKVTLDVSAVPARVAGAGRYVVELARRLPDAGVELSLVSRRGDVARWGELSRGEVVNIVPDARPARLAYERLVLGRRATREGALWHAPHYTMPHTPAPTAVTIHDLTVFSHPEWHERTKVVVFRRAIRYAATHANVVICVSDFTRRALESTLDVKVPLVVAPMGVDLEHFHPVGNDDDVFRGAGLPEVPYVLFVGTVEPRKGLDVLEAAFALLGDAHPDLELWLAGQAGWATNELERRLATHRFRSRIRRLGYVSDELVPALMRRARVVAYPSRAEGVGMPVLEALACGALVVTTSQTVMAELAGPSACYADAGDAEGLAGAIDELLTLSDAEVLRRRERARQWAQRYDWDTMIRAHLAAYQLAKEAS